MLPLFEAAAKNAEAFIQKSDEEREMDKHQKREENKKRIIFHLKYHPDDPPFSVIQRIFRECILHPKGERPFPELTNHAGMEITIERLTVCYSNHPNLGSMLSYRKICNRKGLKDSSFLKEEE